MTRAENNDLECRIGERQCLRVSNLESCAPAYRLAAGMLDLGFRWVNGKYSSRIACIDNQFGEYACAAADIQPARRNRWC